MIKGIKSKLATTAAAAAFGLAAGAASAADLEVKYGPQFIEQAGAKKVRLMEMFLDKRVGLDVTYSEDPSLGHCVSMSNGEKEVRYNADIYDSNTYSVVARELSAGNNEDGIFTLAKTNACDEQQDVAALQLNN